MSSEKQLTLYNSQIGANGWKVAIILEELGLTYETIFLDQRKGLTKIPGHVKYNPNGRIPTLIDHSNKDFVVWESNAILTYLVERYDTDHKISVADSEERIHQLQWLFFQASGQGPYFGQTTYFMFSHPEKIPSVIDRYKNETLRVFGVLESVLSTRNWLVGGKCTIADLSFVTWNFATNYYMPGYNNYDLEKDFPAVYRWQTAMTAREPVARNLALWADELKSPLV